MRFRNVVIPLRAFARSTQPFGWSLSSVHIEPVRSSTIMMSSGFEPHGEHAVDFACTVNDLTPSTLANTVFTVADSETVTAFAVVQPGNVDRHLVLTVSETASLPPSAFFSPVCAPKFEAVEIALLTFGRLAAPASAAASAVAWSLRCTEYPWPMSSTRPTIPSRIGSSSATMTTSGRDRSEDRYGV